MGSTDAATRRTLQTAGLVIGLVCWLAVSVAYLAGVFETIDLRLLDWRFRIRGERVAPDSISIVGIDDATIRAYGRWPLPRDQYAVLLTALGEAGATAIGIDLQLPPDRNQDPKADALLAYACGANPGVVPAIWFHAATDEAGVIEPPSAETLTALAVHGITAPGVPAPQAATVSLPFPELVQTAGQLGHITVAADRDGAIRRQPIVVRYGERLYFALALRLAGTEAGFTDPPEAAPGRAGLRVGWPRGPRWDMPLDRDGLTAIDFAGDRAAFPHWHSMLDVLQQYQSGDRQRLRNAFKGRIVLIGLDSRQEVSEDVGATPFSAATPLLFVHANVLDNLLRGRFLSRSPTPLYLLALAVLAVLFGWAFTLASVPRSAALLGVGTTIVGGVDFLLLSAWAIDAPSVAPLLVGPVVYAAVQSYRFVFLERRHQKQVEDLREGRTIQMQLRPEALVGEKLSHYRIEEKLGAGGMGVVYLALDERLGRRVAVKVLPGRAFANEPARRRFRREARALSKLCHPNIAAIHDYDSQDGTDFIAMEFVTGTSLARRIGRGSLPEAEMLRVGSQVADALVHAHARGIVHRDLKPQNIVLTEQGDAKVLDFGLARLLKTDSDGGTLSESLTASGQVVGTIPYMPPESFRGIRSDERGDLYSLGVVLFEMATGRRPFKDDEPHELIHTILQQPPPDPRVLNGRLSIASQRLILRTLEKDPAHRFASAKALLEAIRSAGARPNGSDVAETQ